MPFFGFTINFDAQFQMIELLIKLKICLKWRILFTLHALDDFDQ